MRLLGKFRAAPPFKSSDKTLKSADITEERRLTNMTPLFTIY